MSAMSEIKNLKCDSFVEAKKVSFPVVDETQSLVGTLVPIGEWIFDHKDIIEQINNKDVKNYIDSKVTNWLESVLIDV